LLKIKKSNKKFILILLYLMGSHKKRRGHRGTMGSPKNIYIKKKIEK
jgi:hypothetical protein